MDALSAESITANARALDREIAWVSAVIKARWDTYFAEEPAADDGSKADIRAVPPPDLTGDSSGLAALLEEHAMAFEDRLVFALALTPHIRPEALERFFVRQQGRDRGFCQFGGRSGSSHGGFLPTLETVAFLLAGRDIEERLRLLMRLQAEDSLVARGVIVLNPPSRGEPPLSAGLGVSSDALARVTTGVSPTPDFSAAFPARLTTTRLGWEDLVLPREVVQEVDHITAWMEHEQVILAQWELGRSLKPGYRCLFWGPPGTGKTLTATLMGVRISAPVYKIDLSMVVSKYIGETEKNLANVFDQARRRRWVLFFDEADALFGKRTETSSGHDRYANQEVSYLLQRVEDFEGLVILATNLKTNIDEAFARRFQSVVHFPMPDVDMRLRLWRGLLGERGRLDDDVDLEEIAGSYEVAGGAMANVARHAAIAALKDGGRRVRQSDLIAGIRRELRKEGRTP